MKIEKQTQKDGNQSFLVITDKAEIDVQREASIDHLIEHITVKGFRQGKAPKNIASAQLNPDKLADHLLDHVLNAALTEIYKSHQLKVIGRPKMDDLKLNKDGGWDITISFPVHPEIKLGDYEKKISKLKKDKKEEADRINEICDLLLKEIDFPISQTLIDSEVNYSLQRMTDQAKNLNLTTEQYLGAIKRTLEEVKKEYADKAKESIKLDLIFMEIASEKKIEVTEDEIKKATKLEELTPEQLAEVRPVLIRRKTIEQLLAI